MSSPHECSVRTLWHAGADAGAVAEPLFYIQCGGPQEEHVRATLERALAPHKWRCSLLAVGSRIAVLTLLGPNACAQCSQFCAFTNFDTKAAYSSSSIQNSDACFSSASCLIKMSILFSFQELTRCPHYLRNYFNTVMSDNAKHTNTVQYMYFVMCIFVYFVICIL